MYLLLWLELWRAINGELRRRWRRLYCGINTGHVDVKARPTVTTVSRRRSHLMSVGHSCCSVRWCLGIEMSDPSGICWWLWDDWSSQPIWRSWVVIIVSRLRITRSINRDPTWVSWGVCSSGIWLVNAKTCDHNTFRVRGVPWSWHQLRSRRFLITTMILFLFCSLQALCLRSFSQVSNWFPYGSGSTRLSHIPGCWTTP